MPSTRLTGPGQSPSQCSGPQAQAQAQATAKPRPEPTRPRAQRPNSPFQVLAGSPGQLEAARRREMTPDIPRCPSQPSQASPALRTSRFLEALPSPAQLSQLEIKFGRRDMHKVHMPNFNLRLAASDCSVLHGCSLWLVLAGIGTRGFSTNP